MQDASKTPLVVNFHGRFNLRCSKSMHTLAHPLMVRHLSSD